MSITRTIPATVAAQWHPTRNGTLTPDQVGDGSNRKVWWRCPAGHNWQARVDTRCRPNNRTGRPAGCPECVKAAPAKASTLQAQRPDLAREWDVERNGCTAAQVGFYDTRKAWWICPARHRYEGWLQNRRSRNSGCPYCTGRKVLAGFNDLATTRPETAAVWHPTRNGDLTPQQVSHGSMRVVWWQCSTGHEWQAQIGYQARRTAPCLTCNPQNDHGPLTPRAKTAPKLADDRPEIAAEWHPTRNGDLTAADVTRAARIRVWWLCGTCGNEWQAYVQNRVYRNSGCPACADKARSDAYAERRARRFRPHIPTSPTLQEARPDLAAMWHPTLNGDLTPQQARIGKMMKVWLVLPCGCTTTRYLADIVKRTSPMCSEHGRQAAA